MTPGSNPTHFAAPLRRSPDRHRTPAGRDTFSHLPPSGSHQSALVDQPVTVGGGVIARPELAQACARALSAPVQLIDIGAGGYIVQPLRFYPVLYMRRGRHRLAFVSKTPVHGGLDA